MDSHNSSDKIRYNPEHESQKKQRCIWDIVLEPVMYEKTSNDFDGPYPHEDEGNGLDLVPAQSSLSPIVNCYL